MVDSTIRTDQTAPWSQIAVGPQIAVLAGLPAAERDGWCKLWAEVAALLAKAEGGKR